MKNSTRLQFNILSNNIAKTYGVGSVSKHFSATPTIEQTLSDEIQKSIEFLQRINVLGVDDQEGEALLGDATGIIGKRTDTDNNDRETKSVLNLDGSKYRCEFTEFDTHIKYKTLDAWAKFPDLYQRYSRYVRHAIALSRIMTGFYGESVADVTDSATSPRGEDVNKGWLQQLREYKNGAHFFPQGSTAGQIRMGTGGDFINLDSLVYAILQMIDPIFREAGDLVAIIGQDLLAMDKSQLYVAQGQKPTEKERVENQAVTRTYGSLPAALVPNFPARGLMITSYDNLSLYFQNGSVRQKMDDNSKRNRIEHYTSINDAYVIENKRKAAAIEFKNVLMWNGTAFE